MSLARRGCGHEPGVARDLGFRLVQKASLCVAGWCVLVGFPNPAAAELLFELRHTSIDAQALAGFQEATNRWSAFLDDPITVNLQIGFSSLSSGVIGSTSTKLVESTYGNVRTQLAADAQSAADFSSSAALPSGSSIPVYVNDNAENPNGAGSATPYVDNNGSQNNSRVLGTSANFKAMGFAVPSAGDDDAAITFNSDLTFDFDPSDGIAANAYDFVGVAMHEIGHALGFVSGIDLVDFTSVPSLDDITTLSVLDLFRYSDESLTDGGGVTPDFTHDDRDKYLSIDGGATKGALFSNGIGTSDNRQASHWRDDLGIGLLDPTVMLGEELTLTAADLQAMDVIGFDQTATAVPEPATWLAGLVSLLPLGRSARKKWLRGRDNHE